MSIQIQEPAKQSVSLSEDPYALSPGSLTLKNKLGIRDALDLAECELVLSASRRAQGVPTGDYSWDHLKAIHHHLFQDVYAWAGEARTVDIKSYDGQPFTTAGDIEQAMQAIFKDLEKDSFLIGLDESEFAEKSAQYYARMNAVHPFRSGNGRAVRQFLEELANNNGLKLNWKNTSRSEWNLASKEAMAGNSGRIRTIMKSVTQQRELELAASRGMTSTERQRSAEQGIKLIVKNIKEGKGLGNQSDLSDVSDFTDDNLSDRGGGMSMD